MDLITWLPTLTHFCVCRSHYRVQPAWQRCGRYYGLTRLTLHRGRLPVVCKAYTSSGNAFCTPYKVDEMYDQTTTENLRTCADDEQHQQHAEQHGLMQSAAPSISPPVSSDRGPWRTGLVPYLHFMPSLSAIHPPSRPLKAVFVFHFAGGIALGIAALVLALIAWYTRLKRYSTWEAVEQASFKTHTSNRDQAALQAKRQGS